MANRADVVMLSNLSSSGFANGPTNNVNSHNETNNDGRLLRMQENEFVTQRDLNHLEEKTNLKLENLKTEIKGEFTNLETKMDGKFVNLETKMDGKFNTLDEKLERMFLQQKIDMTNERKENIKWIVGTGLGVIGTIAAILALFPSLKL